MYDINYQIEQLEIIGDFMDEVRAWEEEYADYVRDMESHPFDN